MLLAFLILGAFTAISACCAMAMRNLVHCALWLAVSLASLAGLYLQLHAPFVAFAQVLVYIGAVAILIVFAILLTPVKQDQARPVFSSSWWLGGMIAALVLTGIAGAVWASSALPVARAQGPGVSVRQIGMLLMNDYVLALEAAGLLLTAALIGAVVIAMPHERGRAKAGIEPGPSS